jgi:hypothetical protein
LWIEFSVCGGVFVSQLEDNVGPVLGVEIDTPQSNPCVYALTSWKLCVYGCGLGDFPGGGGGQRRACARGWLARKPQINGAGPDCPRRQAVPGSRRGQAKFSRPSSLGFFFVPDECS